MENKILTINTESVLKQPTIAAKLFEIYNLVKENDPILKQVAKPFDFANPPVSPIYLSHSLFETMFKNKGIGLAAPQVGIPYRVFVMGGDKDNKQVFFNPMIIEFSESSI